MRGESSITAPGACTNPAQQRHIHRRAFCLFSTSNSQGGSIRTCPRRLLLFLSSPTPNPFSQSSVAVDGGPFFCSLEPPPRKYWQSSISLTGRQPLPESRVGGISGFWTALRRESCKKQGTGTKTNSPFTVCFVPTRYLLTSKNLSISATYFNSSKLYL
jgi:hypothetical protein